MSGAAPAPADKGSGAADGSAAPEQAEEALTLVRGMGFGEAAAAAALQAGEESSVGGSPEVVRQVNNTHVAKRCRL